MKDKSFSLALIYQGMDAYLQRLVLTKEGKPGGKKFHDPLAACCAINEEIATWAEVELYREGQKWGGEWGAKLSPGSGTWIITDLDHEKFVQTLTAID